MKPAVKRKLFLSFTGVAAVIIIALIVAALQLNQVITAIAALILIFVINKKAKESDKDASKGDGLN